MSLPLSQPITSDDTTFKPSSFSYPAQEPEIKTWHHDCSNTSGFEYKEISMEFWESQWVYTAVDLESDGQSFPMPDFTNTSPVSGYYGPAYVHTLSEPFPLSGLRNFSVHMELNNTDPAYYGVVYVGLFDELYDPVLVADIHDWFRYDPQGGCRWKYYLRHPNIHRFALGDDSASYYELGYSQHWMEYVNITWSTWFVPSHGLNGSIPAYDPMPARNGTIIPAEEVETARNIRYLVLMFGGHCEFQYNPLPPFRVHDIYLEYEVGGDIDTTPPSLTSVTDIVYIIGQTGNTIVWNCTDDYPYRYWVVDYEHSYTWPDTNRKKGLWNGSSITISVDGLEVGNRTFHLILQDKAGFMVWDFVTVMVIEHPLVSFIKSNALVLGGALFVAVACIILYWTGKRGKTPSSHWSSFNYD